MREVDDRYPEFAEPYEPVKGGRHHKGFQWNKRKSDQKFPVFLAGIFVVGSLFVQSPKANDPNPSETAAVPVQTAEPSPTPEPSSSPEPAATVEPSPAPEIVFIEATPAPVPTPAPSPPKTPSAVITPTPTPAPIATPVPAPTPTPVPTPEAAHSEPEFYMDSQITYKGNSAAYFAYPVTKVLLNDLKGGKATMKLYVRDGDGNFQAYENSVAEYNGEDIEVWVPEIEYYFDKPGYASVKETAKIVLDYTYADGTTGKYESDEFHMYAGGYLYRNQDYGTYGSDLDVLNQTLSFEYYFDDELVDYTKVKWNEFTLTQTLIDDSMARIGDPITLDISPEINTYTGTDGKHYVRFTYTLNNLEQSSDYEFESTCTYDEDGGNNWEGYLGGWHTYYKE